MQDDVIAELYFEQTGSIFDLLRQQFVLVAGLYRAGRMIVTYDYMSRLQDDRLLNNEPDIDHSATQSPFPDLACLENFGCLIQVNDPKLLVRESGDFILHEFHDIERIPDVAGFCHTFRAHSLA